jgi:prenylcysteine oxidase / farnesylcysteine lyase
MYDSFASPHVLSPLHFNLPADQETPTTILTTLKPNEVPSNPENRAGSAGFFSISTLQTVTNPKTGLKEYLYKIFSPSEITAGFLSGILGTEGTSSFSSYLSYPPN